jgi:hypothetical protein
MDAAALAVEVYSTSDPFCRARPPKSRIAYAAVGPRGAALRPSLPGPLPALGEEMAVAAGMARRARRALYGRSLAARVSAG